MDITSILDKMRCLAVAQWECNGSESLGQECQLKTSLRYKSGFRKPLWILTQRFIQPRTARSMFSRLGLNSWMPSVIGRRPSRCGKTIEISGWGIFFISVNGFRFRVSGDQGTLLVSLPTSCTAHGLGSRKAIASCRLQCQQTINGHLKGMSLSILSF